MAGRIKYTPERVARLLEGLKAGMTRMACCGAAHIDRETLTRWEKRYPSFAAQVRQAEAEAEARYSAIIAKAAFGHEVTIRREVTKPVVVKTVDANGIKHEHLEHITEVTFETRRETDWRAALEWLKRRRKEDWSERAELVGAAGDPAVLTIRYVNDWRHEQQPPALPPQRGNGEAPEMWKIEDADVE
ncbi:MAG TPA: hypothetical protein VKJ47_13540 [Candidatus Binatia bacterium]|nr:hypothetical protein [Candidatus Binatia bacterium]